MPSACAFLATLAALSYSYASMALLSGETIRAVGRLLGRRQVRKNPQSPAPEPARRPGAGRMAPPAGGAAPFQAQARGRIPRAYQLAVSVTCDGRGAPGAHGGGGGAGAGAGAGRVGRGRACQRRRKNVPARRRKSVPRARWQLVPVVHGRDPRAGRCALRAAGGGPRVGGACGPTGSSGGLFGRLPAS